MRPLAAVSATTSATECMRRSATKASCESFVADLDGVAQLAVRSMASRERPSSARRGAREASALAVSLGKSRITGKALGSQLKLAELQRTGPELSRRFSPPKRRNGERNGDVAQA